jgi:hypothetical protein
MNKRFLLTITKSCFLKWLNFSSILRFSICFFITFSITLSSINAYAITRELVFDPSPDTRVTGYKLYYGKTEIFDIIVDLKNQTRYDLNDLEEGATYYFAAKAYDEYGNESAFSDILVYTVPISTPSTLTIVASADSGGSISPAGNITINYDGSQTFTITPDTGHKILDVIVDGQSKGIINTYTFNNVTSDKTISATFETLTHSIKASAESGGSITPAGEILITDGGSQTFTITPVTGYKIQDVIVDGESKGEISTYTFKDITSSHTIAVTFEAIVNSKPDPDPHIIEMGEVFVNHEWQRVSFTGIFIDPVVVAKPASLNDPKPAVVRIRNVDEAGFDIRIQQWEYLKGIHGYENVSYLAMEKGYYVLPEGIIMEAGSFEADGNNFRVYNYSGTFNQIPVVIASVTSVKDPTAVTGRIHNVSQNGFEYYLQKEEKNKKKHGVETVSFIACEPFSGVMNQLKLEVGTTGNQVNHNFHYLSYKEKFSNIPYFLGDMQTTHDSDTANVRWRNKNHYGVEIHISEEKSRDAELNHNNENLGYIIIMDGE